LPGQSVVGVLLLFWCMAFACGHYTTWKPCSLGAKGARKACLLLPFAVQASRDACRRLLSCWPAQKQALAIPFGRARPPFTRFDARVVFHMTAPTCSPHHSQLTPCHYTTHQHNPHRRPRRKEEEESTSPLPACSVACVDIHQLIFDKTITHGHTHLGGLRGLVLSGT